MLTGLPLAFWAVAFGVFGALIGSFIANLCLRWPRGDSVLGGRSKCDACGRTLGPMELVPVFSAIAMGGQCKTCRGRIDPLHWRVEISSAAIGIAAVLALGVGVQAFSFAVLGWLLLPLAILDWRHFWLPDRLTLVVAVAGLALGGWASGETLLNRVVAGTIGFLCLSAIALAYRRLTGVEGMGQGDPKLFGALGFWIGINAMPLLLLFAALSGLMTGLLGRDRNSKTSARMVAFGTMMCLAALPTLFIYREIF